MNLLEGKYGKKYTDEFKKLAEKAYYDVNMVKKYCEEKNFLKASAQVVMIQLTLVTDLHNLIGRIKRN